jgi:hypothetical protein
VLLVRVLALVERHLQHGPVNAAWQVLLVTQVLLELVLLLVVQDHPARQVRQVMSVLLEPLELVPLLVVLHLQHGLISVVWRVTLEHLVPLVQELLLVLLAQATPVLLVVQVVWPQQQMLIL